jgi:hypothetical protein
MKQLLVLTHRYTVLQETEKTLPIINRPTREHVTFLRKYKDKFFLCVCGYKTTTENVCFCNPAV